MLGLRRKNKKRHDVDRLMVSVMSFIVYGGVPREVVAGGIVPMGVALFWREKIDVFTPAFTFSFSLHSCRAAHRSAAFSSKESPC